MDGTCLSLCKKARPPAPYTSLPFRFQRQVYFTSVHLQAKRGS
jgi:hypothetical protein